MTEKGKIGHPEEKNFFPAAKGIPGGHTGAMACGAELPGCSG